MLRVTLQARFARVHEEREYTHFDFLAPAAGAGFVEASQPTRLDFSAIFRLLPFSWTLGPMLKCHVRTVEWKGTHRFYAGLFDHIEWR